MKRNRVFPKFLAIAGTILTWIPILAPLGFSLILLITRKIFRFDYLMPAELFPSALLGAILLFWAACQVKTRRKWIGWSFVASILLLLGSQTFAVITGLASGRTQPVGWPWIIVLTMLAVFTLALISIGIGGVLLIRDLFKPSQPEKVEILE